jgi:DNA mismatch repair protein MSH6
MHYLASRILCLGLFSTHYGLLTSEFSPPVCACPSIRLMCMESKVNDNERNVVFLYRLIDG